MAQGSFGNIEPELPPKKVRRSKPEDVGAAELRETARRAGQAGILAIVMMGGFNAISFYRGPHWRLSRDEALMCSTDLNNAVNQILPPEYLEVWDGVLRKFGPVVGFGLSITAVVGKRLAIDREILAAKKGTVGTGAKSDGRPNGLDYDSGGAWGDAGRGDSATGDVGAW